MARGAGAYGWYFSSTVSAPPDWGFMVTLSVFAAVSSSSTVHFEVPTPSLPMVTLPSARPQIAAAPRICVALETKNAWSVPPLWLDDQLAGHEVLQRADDRAVVTRVGDAAPRGGGHRQAVTGLLADGVDFGVGPRVSRVVDLVGAAQPRVIGSGRRCGVSGALAALGNGSVLGCAELMGTDELVEDPAAEVASLGPRAVSASPAAASTPVDKPQRAVLVRMVPPFTFGGDAPVAISPIPPRTEATTGGSNDFGMHNSPPHRLLQPRGTHQTRQDNRHPSIANTCERRWVQI